MSISDSNHFSIKRLASLMALTLAIAVGLSAEPVLVSAASSLTDVLTSLKPDAEKAIGAPIQFNFGGSGTLRKQIAEGAPVDVFFSAAASDMDALEKAGLLAPKTRVDLVSNAIVLVGEAGVASVAKSEELKPLLSAAKVFAIGNPDSVPAGRYAVQALKSLGLYPLVDGRLVLGNNVREVLQFVQSGSAPLGVVFLTDAMSVKTGKPISVIYRFPASSLATPVNYPAALIAASKNKEAAALFLAFLRSSLADKAFEAAGFVKP